MTSPQKKAARTKGRLSIDERIDLIYDAVTKADKAKTAGAIHLDIGLTALGGTLPLPKGTRVEYVDRRGKLLVVAIATGKAMRTKRGPRV